MTKNKMKKDHRDNSIVSFGLLIFTTITLIAVSANDNISTFALVLACISFLGAIFNLLYVWCNDYQEEKEQRRHENRKGN